MQTKEQVRAEYEYVKAARKKEEKEKRDLRKKYGTCKGKYNWINDEWVFVPTNKSAPAKKTNATPTKKAAKKTNATPAKKAANDKTVKELKDQCKSEGIVGYFRLAKADLVKLCSGK